MDDSPHQTRNQRSKQHIRIIMRPWTPRNVPYAIPIDSVEKILLEAYPKLQKVLYVGWVKRRANDRTVLYYLAATGATASQARQAFKNSEEYGINIWKLVGK